MQDRALQTVKSIAIPGESVLLCSHGDVIKAIVAGLLGLHLDNFQSLSIDPASISIVQLSGDNARIQLLNNTNYLNHLRFTGDGKKNLNLGGGGGASRE
jgi:probable phosphoglycerate mutase